MAATDRWHGVFAYLPTLLDAEERLDASATRALVDHLIDNGLHGLTTLGSTGEFPYLDAAEKARLAECTVAAAAGRVPVVQGVGGFAVRDVAAQVRAAESAGVQGLLCVQQAFYTPTDDETVRFHEAIAASTDLPIVVYHNPAQCRVPFSDQVVARLASIPNVVAFKDASGNLRNIRRWPALADGQVDMFAATAVPLVPAMLHGAVGWMSGPASVIPRESVLIYDLCRTGRWEQAVTVEGDLAPLGAAFGRLGQAQTVKALLHQQGFGSGRLTAPLLPVDEGEAAALADVLRELAAHVARFEPVP